MYGEAMLPAFHNIVPEDSTLEVVAHGLLFGEGPVWDAREGALYFVDIIGDTIWKWISGVGSQVVLRPSGKANGMTYDKLGRLVVAGWTNRNVWRMDTDGRITSLATHYKGQKLTTPNDIVVKSDGTIYFTDSVGGVAIVGMEVEDVQQYREGAAVFKLDAESRELVMVTDKVPGNNGLAFSPDESLLYVNDTGLRNIKVFDVLSNGMLGEGRLFAEVVGDEFGQPDGMKVDVDGNVYCTGPGGIHIFDAHANYLGRLRLPGHITNMAWGDIDWRTLYITSRTSVMRIRLNVQGIPV